MNDTTTSETGRDGSAGPFATLGQTSPSIGAEPPPQASDLGTLLCATRMRLGKDLQDVAAVLHIRYNFLVAIEDGRFEDLPGQAYAIGFVRAYADHLGLDGDEVVRRYKEETAGIKRVTRYEYPIPPPESGIPSGALLLIAVVLGMMVYGVWYTMADADRRAADVIQEVPDRLAALLRDDAAPETPADAGAEAQIAAAVSEDAVPPAESDDAVAPVLDADKTETPATADTVAAPAPTVVASNTPPPATAPAQPETQPAASQTAAPQSVVAKAPTPAEPAKTSPPTTTAPTTPAADAPKPAQSSTTPPAAKAPETKPAPAKPEERTPSADTPPVASPKPAVQTVTAQSSPPAQTPKPPQTTTASAPSATAPAPAAAKPPVKTEAPKTEVPKPEIPKPEPAKPATTQVASATTPTSTSTTAATPPPVATKPQTIPGATPASTTTAASTPSPTASKTTKPAPVPASRSSGVELRAKSDSWIQVRDGEQLLLTRFLRKGESYKVPDRSGLTLMTLNAGGVEVIVDGAVMPPLGEPGSVARGVSLDADKLKAQP